MYALLFMHTYRLTVEICGLQSMFGSLQDGMVDNGGHVTLETPHVVCRPLKKCLYTV